MKALVFDAGPIISLTTNNLLWLLEPMRRHFGGRFYIPKSVKRELIDTPLQGNKFKYQAFQVLHEVATDVLQIAASDQILRKAKHLEDLANSIFKAQGNWIKIVDFAEMESLSATLFLNAQAVVVDERTTRLLVEAPSLLKEHLERRLHQPITVETSRLKEFQRFTKDIHLFRSVEFITIAYELGLFNTFMQPLQDAVLDPQKILLESLVWSVKMSGCSVSKDELHDLLRESLQRSGRKQAIQMTR